MRAASLVQSSQMDAPIDVAAGGEGGTLAAAPFSPPPPIVILSPTSPLSNTASPIARKIASQGRPPDRISTRTCRSGLQDCRCCRTLRDESEQLDPTATWIRELRLHGNIFYPGSLEFHDVFLSASLFDNMKSATDVHNYVHKQLQLFASETLTHREIAADGSFSLRKLYPKPTASAIQTTALSQGWSPGSMLGSMLDVQHWFLRASRDEVG